MPIKMRETGESRSLSDGLEGDKSGALRYRVSGTTEVSEVRAYVLANVPQRFEGMLFQTIDINSVGKGDNWEVEVEYNRKRVAPGEFSISFDTSGATSRLTASYGTTRYPATAPDFGGAIGVNDDGQVEGVDIIIPTLSISVRATIVDTYVTSSYIQALSDLTGKVSSTPFLGWAAGEVLFTGASGEWRLNENLQLNFNFAVSRNVTGLTIGSLASITKNGHDYIWLRFEKQTDTASTPPSPVTKPESAHVEVVYQTADLNALMIGVL